MSEQQLITVGEATQQLGVTSELSSNKCLTKAEFDTLVNKIPELMPNGVYIMHKNGFLVKKDEWSYSNIGASGVALKTDKCRIVIAKEEQTSIVWGINGTLISGCFTTTDEGQAKTDFNGKSNTDAIVYQLSNVGMYTALYCKEFTFLHGVKGYLGSLGEWNEVYQHKAEIDECMSKIGGKPLYDSSLGNHLKWCSTQHSSNIAWYMYFSDGSIDKTYNKEYNTPNSCARPFAPFK